MEQSHTAWRWIAASAVALYLTLATAAMLTREPWCDEAWFNSPALNLATRGYMGTAYLDPVSNIGKDAVRLDGIDHYTYWMTPLYLVVQAAWFKVAGFGLMRARMTGILWGLVALLAWWAIAKRLSDRFAASLTILLLGAEYHFVVRATSGRMDVMCAALGVSGLAAYFAVRERSFFQAILLANVGIAAAVITHPIGVVYGVALAVGVLSLDRKRIVWRLLPWCAVPYVAALAGWAAYIAQAPQFFKLQFFGNATHRGPGLFQPWEALKLELWHRYGENFGMASWTTGPARAKILILALYLGGLIYAAASGELRSRAGSRVALLMGASVIVFCWLFEGTKTNLYLPHLLPWLCLLAALAVSNLLETRRVPRWAIAIVLAGVLAIQISATLLPAWRDPYRRQFLPAMAFVARQSQASDTIMSDAVAGFVLGFDRNVVDDAWFGYGTGKKPDWLVITPTYAETIDSLAQQRPDVSHYVNQLVAEYRPVFSNKMYRVYVRKTAPAARRSF
jgi:4-amino-4-deoxy-L-arabinose transferase-like glycosyltransferase